MEMENYFKINLKLILENSIRFLKPSLIVQHFIRTSTENISNIMLARQCRSTLIYWNLSFLSSPLNIYFINWKIGLVGASRYLTVLWSKLAALLVLSSSGGLDSMGIITVQMTRFSEI